MSERGGKKRYNSQPLEGANKDTRYEIDEDLSWSTVVSGRNQTTRTSNRYDVLNNPNSYPDNTMRGSSVCSRGSARGAAGGSSRPTFQPISQQQQQQQQHTQRSNNRPLDLGENTRFTTPAADGPLRDEIVVECQRLNDQPFKGTITFNEAVDTIFTDIMGFQFSDLYSVRMRYSGCPVVRFKLKNQTNIDDLIGVEYFNLERKAPRSENIDYIACKILGIRGMQSVPHYDGTDNDVRWIKIEGCEYQMTEDEIKQSLLPFGELLTPVREDIHEDSDSERERIGNGTNSCKMKLTRPIPQFLPVLGRRIRIYYSGIDKLCTNCYGRHTRRQCKNSKRPWIEYVRDFMFDNEDLPAEYYGKWWDIVDTEYPGYFESSAQDSNQAPPSQPAVEAETVAVESRNPPRLNRDPRLNRTHRVQRPQQPPTPHALPRPQPTFQTDRQHEMSRLLASGLTLTDAKKYLDNKAELAEIEKRMSNPNDPQNNSRAPSTSTGQHTTSRGRGLNRNY